MENQKTKLFSVIDEQFYLRLSARNGEPVLASEGYVNNPGY